MLTAASIDRPGISPEFLAQVQVRLVDVPEPGSLFIPYFDANGNEVDFHRIRLAHVRPDGQKYTQPAGSEPHLYFPRSPLGPASTLFFLEGEFKRMSMQEAGHTAIGLPGLHCYTRPIGGKPVILPGIAEARDLVKPERVCFIGDSDTFTNLEYFRSAHVLASAFAPVAVYLLQLPLGGPKGIDDLRGQLDGEFPSWLEHALGNARLINPKESFLFPAQLQLEAATETLEALPSDQRERHRHRIVTMATLARITKQSAFAIERFCDTAQKATGMTKLTFEKCVQDEIKRLVPNSPEQQQHGARPSREVQLVDVTEPWVEPVDGLELFKEIYHLIGRVVWVPEPARIMMAHWLIAHYVFKCFPKFAYLRIKSPERNCGKSTLVDVLERCVYNPIVASDITPAALYRLAEEFQPSILFDEFDNKDMIMALTQLLNAGFEPNRSAIRFNNESGKLERFRTFCPKIIASIERLDETTESRCLIVDMARVPADAEKTLEEICDLDPAIFLTIKRKILRFVQDHLTEFQTWRPTRPDWLKTREWDLWRPLFVVAEIIGGAAPNLIRQAAAGISKGRTEEHSLAIEILSHLRAASKQSYVTIEPKQGSLFLPSEKLVDYCNGDEEAIWSDWKKGDKLGLTVHRLGQELRRHFKVSSHQIWFQSKTVRGYWLKQLKPHFNSFLPPEDDTTPPSGNSPEPPEPDEPSPESPDLSSFLGIPKKTWLKAVELM